MSDEANANYFAMIDQLIEGHQWLDATFGYKPRSGWSIDPFGQSSSMAYFLRRTGFESMLIQRIHYSVKKYLASHKKLEFMWRQEWDEEGTTDILTHMMPFYSYDIPHTCGPEPAVCCQFDFARLPGGRFYCPWNISPAPIGSHNVKERATKLLDQYRKKAQLYQSDVVFIPLGDDFRWQGMSEAMAQFDNYERLFEELNGNPQYSVEIAWGTLSDYFDALRKNLGTKALSSKQDTSLASFAQSAYSLPHSNAQPSKIRSLTGDFFTYADRDDHYWSGYYTTRAFYKRADRILESTLRAAEIQLTLCRAELSLATTTSTSSSISSFLERLMPTFSRARRNLGLYQHHDGVTGTAKDEVVVDYGNRMHESVTQLQDAMRDMTEFLLSSDKPAFFEAQAQGRRELSQSFGSESAQQADSLVLHIEESGAQHNSLLSKKVVNLKPASSTWKPVSAHAAGSAATKTVESHPKANQNRRAVVFYNSLGQNRLQIAQVYVSTADFTSDSPGKTKICVTTADGVPVASQTAPVFEQDASFSTQHFALFFEVSVPALGVSTYFIHELSLEHQFTCTPATAANAVVYNGLAANSAPLTKNFGVFSVQILGNGPSAGIEIGNDEYHLSISPSTGVLQSVTLKTRSQDLFAVKESFLKYGTYRSGAYLFLPNGPAIPFHDQMRPLIRVVKGTLVQESHVVIPTGKVTRVLRLYSPTAGSHSFSSSLIETRMLVDVGADHNQETVVRYSTSVDSRDVFYTDLNGFQTIRRKTMKKLPIQGNFYPMPSLAFIQDEDIRFSIHSRQALGCASLQSGWLEVMLDRRLNQDDERGLGQGITDNLPNEVVFYLTIESQLSSSSSSPSFSYKEEEGVFFKTPSLLSHMIGEELNHPLVTFISAHVSPQAQSTHKRLSWGSYAPLSAPMPCDVHIVNFRTVPEGSALILRKRGKDCSFNAPSSLRFQCGFDHQNPLSLYVLFSRYIVTGAQQKSLTLMHDLGVVPEAEILDLKPMELYSFVLTFSDSLK